MRVPDWDFKTCNKCYEGRPDPMFAGRRMLSACKYHANVIDTMSAAIPILLAFETELNRSDHDE